MSSNNQPPDTPKSSNDGPNAPPATPASMLSPANAPNNGLGPGLSGLAMGLNNSSPAGVTIGAAAVALRNTTTSPRRVDPDTPPPSPLISPSRGRESRRASLKSSLEVSVDFEDELVSSDGSGDENNGMMRRRRWSRQNLNAFPIESDSNPPAPPPPTPPQTVLGSFRVFFRSLMPVLPTPAGEEVHSDSEEEDDVHLRLPGRAGSLVGTPRGPDTSAVLASVSEQLALLNAPWEALENRAIMDEAVEMESSAVIDNVGGSGVGHHHGHGNGQVLVAAKVECHQGRRLFWMIVVVGAVMIGISWCVVAPWMSRTMFRGHTVVSALLTRAAHRALAREWNGTGFNMTMIALKWNRLWLGAGSDVVHVSMLNVAVAALATGQREVFESMARAASSARYNALKDKLRSWASRWFAKGLTL